MSHHYLVVSDLHLCDIEEHRDGWKAHKSERFAIDEDFAALLAAAAETAQGLAAAGLCAVTEMGSRRLPALVAALGAADLVATLQGDGPFTVFAPTDEAFAKLPEGTVEALIADPEQLRAILLYHVVPGKVSAADVISLTSATTAQGSDVNIRVADGSVMVNNALVTATDIETSNGVIHVIDTVILPAS